MRAYAMGVVIVVVAVVYELHRCGVKRKRHVVLMYNLLLLLLLFLVSALLRTISSHTQSFIIFYLFSFKFGPPPSNPAFLFIIYSHLVLRLLPKGIFSTRILTPTPFLLLTRFGSSKYVPPSVIFSFLLRLPCLSLEIWPLHISPSPLYASFVLDRLDGFPV